MLPLFAYGTLRDPGYQVALFDRTYPTEPATLPGWRVVVAENGYFSVVRDPAGSASGDLMTLDARGWELADGWEDVPAYERVAAEARTADGRAVPCIVYVRPTASRTEPPAGALAARPRADVLAAIARFRASGG